MTNVVLCPECRHDTNLHFYENDYPELGFCQISNCLCTCSLFRKIDDVNDPS